ncbi:MAG TPA: hypothetical protein VL285_13115 [Bryobacteraceae bacterium]|nr:hypothetical protein [Bryobacteraceae bacterium]
MCLLALPSLAAESNQDRGKRIVDEALAAIGGKNFLGLRDLVVSGRAYSFYREELSGLSIAKIYTRYLIRPEPPVAGFFGLRERESFGKKEESSVVFTEKDAYEITFRGARPIPEDRYNRFRESTLRDVLYILRQRLGEPGLTIESRHTDVIDNQPVEIVDISDSDNRIVTVYFQRSTKLPIRQVTERRDPKTNERNEEVTVYSKFRDVGGGVMWPFAVQRERNGEKIFSMFAESVKINQDLTDNLFTLPADMKILGGPKKAIELKK